MKHQARALRVLAFFVCAPVCAPNVHQGRCPLRISNPERREGEIRVDDEIAGLTAARYSEYSAYTEAPIW